MRHLYPRGTAAARDVLRHRIPDMFITGVYNVYNVT